MACVSFMFFSAFGQENDSDRNKEGRRGFRSERMEEFRQRGPQFENGLTEEQNKAIKEIRLKSAKEAKPLKFKLKELKARYQTLINEDSPNLNAINANIDEMSKVKNQLAKIKAKTRVEIFSKLTDEQKLLFSSPKMKKGKKPFAQGRMPTPEVF